MIENNKLEISIVVPFYNEEKGIDAFFERILPILNKLSKPYEIICINDGSRDDTLRKLLYHRSDCPCIKIINLARNFGKENALTAGLHFSSGQAAIPIDADLQDPPELIETLISKWREGYDVVYAVRRKRHGESWIKRFTANLFYQVINWFSKQPIPKNTGDFRLLDRRVVKVLNQLPERSRFMKGLFAWVGFKQVGVYYDREPRLHGQTTWNYWKLWNFALDGITSFSTSMLKVWSYVGLLFSLLSFGYATFIIIRTLWHGKDVPGYASLLVVILFLGGIILISLGIIGEYLGRIFLEIKGRPLYIISDIYGIEKKEPTEN